MPAMAQRHCLPTGSLFTYNPFSCHETAVRGLAPITVFAGGRTPKIERIRKIK